MAKKRTETTIQKVSPGFLADYQEDASLDLLRQQVEVPRLKLVQAVTDQKLKDAFGEGSGIVRPGDVLICTKDDSFSFVPLFFFIEWCRWADIKDSTPFPIVERTIDPASKLAQKAKNPDSRFEVYPEDIDKPEKQQRHYRNCEHLRFISIIYGEHELKFTPLTISFERGEYRQGKNFISAVSMRREMIDDEPRPVPLWAQVWNLAPAHRSPDADRRWWGFDYSAATPGIIDEADAPALREQHLMFKKSFEDKLLQVQEVDNMEPEQSTTDDM